MRLNSKLLIAAVFFASNAAYAQTISPSGGSGGGPGTVTSVTAGLGLASTPNPIIGTGTISTTEVLGNSGAAITGTTYTVDLTSNITTSDLSRELVFTGSGASAWTLGSGSNGMGFDVVNRGTADITITATGNINGNSTLVIQPGLSANIFFGNSTWNAFNIPIATSSQFGAMKPDNSTITCTAGVCSSSGGSSADGSFNQNIVSTYWYWALPGVQSNNGSAFSSGVAYFRPFYAGTSYTIGAVGAYLVTLSAGGNCAFAIYASDPSTGRPASGAPLGSVSGVSTATAGPIHGNLSVAVTKGNWYWDAILCDNTTVTFTANSGTGGFTDNWMVGSSSEANMNGNATNHFNEYKIGGQTYPTFPSSPTLNDSGASAQRTPLFYHRIASVP